MGNTVGVARRLMVRVASDGAHAVRIVRGPGGGVSPGWWRGCDERRGWRGGGVGCGMNGGGYRRGDGGVGDGRDVWDKAKWRAASGGGGGGDDGGGCGGGCGIDSAGAVARIAVGLVNVVVVVAVAVGWWSW